MDIIDHETIAIQLIIRLAQHQLSASLQTSGTGTVYVFIKGSRQRIRIANHGKHRGWFRYNIRTDLKKSREFFFAGQRVYLFVETDIGKAVRRIVHDFQSEKKRNAIAIVKRVRRNHGKKRTTY